MATALAVAQRFLDLAAAEGKTLTNMKLQKLVFFAHGVYLAGFDAPLIEEPIRAWDFGPVIPPLYEKLRKYGRDKVDFDLAPETRSTLENDPQADEAIMAVWEAYRNHTAIQLSQITHLPKTPWDQIWNRPDGRYEMIPNAIIKEYYKNRVQRNAGT
ncbi:DUF4065 domain-containing protein [Herbaspirillum sp. WGmk3]|uniref:Panacea domain-containing protein n=1 Tax=Herbaspirillum sp. WGmk3 TaxID=2919925 RepID=UPI0020910BF9|nr:type II toxin-antitoxin system antitoxin SocA domain-containing protein [Herbaspirillum sp. WGmk3]MCO4857253.1 DUF4065 domain-containing protein [Herbaspirillum sp. WGmk3]